MVRHKNEDSCLVVPPWSSIAIKRHACVFAVADGMGGHHAGEVASSIAMHESYEWFAQTNAAELNKSTLEDMVERVNNAVWAYSQAHPEVAGMGNTFTFMVVAQKRAMVAHIGDSRLYRIRKSEIKQLTHDHSFVAEQVRLGFLTVEQAKKHATKNLLSRVMGCRQFVSADIFEIDLQIGDEFLICSDGVYSMLSDEEIKSIITNSSADGAAKELVEAANRAGGKDNATAVVFAVDSLPLTFPMPWSLKRIRSLLINNVSANGI